MFYYDAVGDLSVQEQGCWVDYAPRGATSILSSVLDTMIHARSNARFIIVVEKDCARAPAGVLAARPPAR